MASTTILGAAAESSPIQQRIIAFGWRLSLLLNIALVLLLAAAAGYASWHLLEKRAISLGARLSAPRTNRDVENVARTAA